MNHKKRKFNERFKKIKQRRLVRYDQLMKEATALLHKQISEDIRKSLHGIPLRTHPMSTLLNKVT